LREVLLSLDDIRKTMAILGIVLGMKSIHPREMIDPDLESANILSDERGRLKIGDFRYSGFCDARLTMTCGAGTPLCIAAEMYEVADYTAAVDVHSFSLIGHERALPATTPVPEGAAG
jgi:hypothetical protein